MIAADLAHLAVPVDQLASLEGNPRRGDVDAVMRSYERFGQRKPIVVRRLSDGRGVVIAGNHQLEAARRLGWAEIAAVWVDDDETTAKAFALADNRTGDLGTYDDADLAAMLAEVAKADAELFAATAWTDAELARLLARLNTSDPEVLPELPEPTTKPGDLWLLGEHRLLCGDATVDVDVALALDGQPVAIMTTDPPYGVELDQSWRDKAGLNRSASGRLAPAQGDRLAGDDRSDWTDAYRLARAEVAFVWHGGIFAGEVAENLRSAGYEIRQQIIWVKPHAPMSRAAYHWRHEPCWYAVRKGGGGHYVGDRTQTTVWEAPSPKQIFGGSDEEKQDHPTQKPVAIFEPAILNHTEPGDVVYDPFGGSGSALIAAERVKRRAVVIEINPRYCDLICRRFEEFTGEAPVLAGSSSNSQPARSRAQ